jgi:hypothetical protein
LLNRGAFQGSTLGDIGEMLKQENGIKKGIASRMGKDGSSWDFQLEHWGIRRPSPSESADEYATYLLKHHWFKSQSTAFFDIVVRNSKTSPLLNFVKNDPVSLFFVGS